MIHKFFLLTLTLIISTSVIPFGVAEDQPALEESPEIVYIEGNVTVSTPDGQVVQAQKGMVVNGKAVIKTQEASYCDIALDKEKKNIISIGPNSEVEVGESIMKLRISKGRVFSELKALKPGSTFEISTPQAIAGVRGTAWETVVDEVSRFNVKDHVIFVEGLDKEGKSTGKSDINEGFSVTVDPSGWLGELAKLTQEDLDRMSSWSDRIQRSLSSASSKRNCGGLIDSYAGDSSGLFQAVVECEVQAGSFAASDSLNIPEELSKQGITGGDITINSIVTVQENQPSAPVPAGTASTPVVKEPPVLRDCGSVTNPAC